MKTEVLLHPKTARELELLAQNPYASVLISGAPGTGLDEVLQQALNTLKQQHQLEQITVTATDDASSLTIEAVRNLKTRLRARVDPGTLRIITVTSADTLTVEAQNSLLKLLEEPGRQTVFWFTSTRPHGLLPTIRSRLQMLEVHDPPLQQLRERFAELPAETLEKLITVTGGRVQLLADLSPAATPDSEGAKQPINQAKRFLQQTPFERLADGEFKKLDRAGLLELTSGLRLVLGGLIRLSAKANNTRQLGGALDKLAALEEIEQALEQNANLKLSFTALCCNL